MSVRKVENAERQFFFLKFVFKKLVYVILAIVIAALAGFAYSEFLVKPTYTASTAVILKMSSDTGSSGSKATTEITLAMYYLPTVAEIAKTPAVIKRANDKYEGSEKDKISASNVNIKYGEESLIFSISYSDKNQQAASKKLDALVEGLSELLSFGQNLIKAEEVGLTPTQNRNSISVDTGKTKFTMLGAVAGAAIAIVVLYVIYKSDKTVKNKAEFEELTGIDVLSLLSNEPRQRSSYSSRSSK